MESKNINVGISLGLIIPRHMVNDFDLKNGIKIEIEFNKGEVVIKRNNLVREGWYNAFAQYAKEGEDKLLLPDLLDSEAEILL